MANTYRVPKSSVRVETSAYEASHGHRPRGFGGWAFSDTRSLNCASDWWGTMGTYSQAKAKAVAHYAKQGVTLVYVLP